MPLIIQSRHSYELNILIQTPFDPKPYHIGTYILNKNILIDSDAFTEPDFRKLKVNPNPVIFSSNWFEQISHNLIILSIFSQTLVKNNSHNIQIILTDKSGLLS